MRQSIWFLAVPLATGLVAGLVTDSAQAGEEFALRAEIPASGLDRVVIEADVGEVTITGADIDTISVVVTLEEDNGWGAKLDEELLNESNLVQKRSRSELRLRVDLPRNIDEDDLQENWEVTVPRSFAARVRMGVGKIDVTDVSGGVDARAGVGAVSIDVPMGDIDAHSSVGDVDVITETQDYGDIELDSNVGAVKLVLRGDRVKANQGWGPGQSLNVEGNGEDRIDASAEVGSVRVRVEK